VCVYIYIYIHLYIYVFQGQEFCLKCRYLVATPCMEIVPENQVVSVWNGFSLTQNRVHCDVLMNMGMNFQDHKRECFYHLSDPQLCKNPTHCR